MSACCDGTGDRKSSTASPRGTRRVRSLFAWILPGALLVLVPKCPACLAAHFALWTGLGLSLSTASYLRGGVLLLCIASLLFLVVERLNRSGALLRHFKQEPE
jgi:hypothetical protein